MYFTYSFVTASAIQPALVRYAANNVDAASIARGHAEFFFFVHPKQIVLLKQNMYM